MYNNKAAKHNVSMAVGQVLLNIDKDGTPSTKLGPKMGMEPRSLTRMLKSLEEKGYIQKEADASDKRLVKILLTEEGKKKRKIARKTVLDFNKQFMSAVPQSKMKTFYEVLGQLNQILEEE